MIKIENLYKDNILKNINLEINKGDVIGIVGPSGAGKSTLLRMLNLLETPTSGNIYIDDIKITDNESININKIRQKIGMIFQSFNLFANYNVIENLTLALKKIKNVSNYIAYRKGMKLLKLVGLEDKARFMPYQLSGGQKQRISIVRSLINDPEYLLFDEPTSALDPEMTLDVLGIIKEVSKKITSIIVSHELSFVREVATKVIFLENGEILKYCPTEDFFNSDDPRIKKFLNNHRTY